VLDRRVVPLVQDSGLRVGRGGIRGVVDGGQRATAAVVVVVVNCMLQENGGLRNVSLFSGKKRGRRIYTPNDDERIRTRGSEGCPGALFACSGRAVGTDDRRAGSRSLSPDWTAVSDDSAAAFAASTAGALVWPRGFGVWCEHPSLLKR
jgi:hypothetical protein